MHTRVCTPKTRNNSHDTINTSHMQGGGSANTGNTWCFRGQSAKICDRKKSQGLGHRRGHTMKGDHKRQKQGGEKNVKKTRQKKTKTRAETETKAETDENSQCYGRKRHSRTRRLKKVQNFRCQQGFMHADRLATTKQQIHNQRI